MTPAEPSSPQGLLTALATGSDEALQGVLFDVDDTLVDTRGAFAVAIGVAAREFLPHVPAEQHDKAVALWRGDAAGHYRAYTRGEISFRQQRINRANELHARFDGPVVDDAGYDGWAAVFDAAFEGAMTAFADALPIVRALADRGLLVGALSNASVARQTDKLANTGLGDDVPMLVGVDTLGVGKPDPQVFAEACRRLGTEPGRTIYVGDELDIDARAATDAGLHGVWLDRPGTRRGGSHVEDRGLARESGIVVVDSLTEFGDLLSLAAISAPRTPLR